MSSRSTGGGSASTPARLGKLEARLEALEGDIHGIRKALERIEDRGERSRPSSLQLLTGLGVAVAIATAVVRLGATGYLETIGRHESELVQTRNHALEAAEQRGRLAGVADLTGGRLERLEAALVEIRASRFTAEDGRRLRLELEEDVTALRTALDEHRADGHPWRVLERMGGLERRLELLEGKRAP